MPIRPVDLKMVTGEASSLYEAIVIMSKRARQINDELKENFERRVAEIAADVDDDQEMINNPDQLIISKEFERLPKPTFIAIDEMLDSEIEFRYRDSD